MGFDTSITLEAKSREDRGKNASRRLRAAGLVPVTVYGGDQDAASTTIVKREFTALLRNHGRNKIFTLNYDGAATPVKIADLQLDPIKGSLIHADLMRISLTEKTNFDLTIKIIGDAERSKNHAGVLDVVTHNIEIRCLPTDLPNEIEVDVSNLAVGDHLSVKDLKLSDKIEVLSDPDTVIATVTALRVEEEPVAVVAETVAEPEVIKKGKTEEKAG